MPQHQLLHFTFIVVFSLLHVSDSINLKHLSILEHSLEATKCDLALIGQDLATDGKIELQRGVILASSGGTFAEDVINKELVSLSNCLILLMSEKVSVNEMLHLATQIQYIKPVGVVYEVKKEMPRIVKAIESRSLSFPIILHNNKGKFTHLSYPQNIQFLFW